MSFTGDGQKLIGDDGTIFDTILGTEVTGDGGTKVPNGVVIITAVDPSSSGWPGTSGASGAAQVGVGRILEIRETDTDITPESGDKYVPLTLAELCDISAWGIQFSSDEIEITSFCDLDKRYRAGKDDMQGTLTGIYTVGVTDKVTGLAIVRNFTPVIRQDGGDTVDVYEQLKSAKLVRFVLNKKDALADYVEFLAPIELFGFNMGAEQGANAQAFDSSLRLTTMVAGAAAVDVLPGLYRRARSDENT